MLYNKHNFPHVEHNKLTPSYKRLQKRKSLRIIVSSATVDAEELRDFFNVNMMKDSSKNNAVIMSVEGRLYPVDVFFLKGTYIFHRVMFVTEIITLTI